MSARNLGRVSFVWLMLLFFNVASAGAQQVLQSGFVYEFRPLDMDCFEQTRGQEGVLPNVEAFCDPGAGAAEVTVASNGSLRALNMEAHARFQQWLAVEAIPDASQQSLIPVHFRIPKVETKVNLFNDTLTAFFGHAGVNILFTIRQDPLQANPDLGNSSLRGMIVEQRRVVSASHGGLGGGCLVSSIAAVATASPGAIFKCTALVAMRLREESSVSLTVLLEAGRTYNVELELEAFVSKVVNPPMNPNFVSVRPRLAGDPVLKWNKMIVSVGTDPRAVTADLQRQIDELRDALERHTHKYLTGRGRGHNNTEAETSTMLLN